MRTRSPIQFRHTIASALLIALSFLLLAPAYAGASNSDDENMVVMQRTFDDLKQQVARTSSDKSLETLSQQTQELLGRINTKLADLTQQIDPINTQLTILGPAPEPDVSSEKEEVSRRRILLEQQRAELEKTCQQATSLKNSVQQLVAQISGLRRNMLAQELTLNSGSILSLRFWRPIITLSEYNQTRITRFQQAFSDANQQVFHESSPVVSFILLATAVILPFFRKRLEVPITKITVKYIPEGRLIHSFYALALILANTALLGFAAGLFAYVYLRVPRPPELVVNFFHEWLNLCILTGLLVGIGRALISKQKPAWRLARISDNIAIALNPFPRIIAGIMFLFGTIEIINITAGASVSTSVVASAMTSLSLLCCMLAMIWWVNRVKTAEDDNDNKQQDTSIHGLVYLLSALFAIVELIALLAGYIGLARYLAYKVIWAFIVISITFFLSRFWVDSCDILFSRNSHAGQFLQRFLKLQDRYMTILSVTFSAVGKVTLLAIMLIALLYGTFGSPTPVDLPGRLRAVWFGQGIAQLNIVPAHLVTALLTFLIALWCLRRTNRWMVDTLLPNTRMAKGMQASVSTLYINVGYVVVIMVSLAGLGIKWNNLAWIVSALSVGIGFGLQEIVKNFISGVILLTERPIRVGDLVSISGIEGDIKKISVRATEIQLSDRSTVIVPNSQFISQNVRNVTRGNSLGVVTISLTWPLEVDPVEIRTLLLEIFNAHSAILATPEASVACTQLDADGITLKATGYVSSARQIFRTKSDLLLEILHRMREQDIDISVPQTIILQQKDSTAAPEKE